MVGQTQRKDTEFINLRWEWECLQRSRSNCFQTSCCEHSSSGFHIIHRKGGAAVSQGLWVNAARMLRFVPCSQLSQSVVVILFGTDTRRTHGKTFLQSDLTHSTCPDRVCLLHPGYAALSNKRDPLESVQFTSLLCHKLILCSSTGIVASPLPSFPHWPDLPADFHICLFRLHTRNK